MKSIGVDAFINAVNTAVENARKQLAESSCQLTRVWVGAAGVDAESEAQSLQVLLAKLFQIPAEHVTVSNDALLIGAPITTSYGVAAIAGTGSVVLCLRRDPHLRICSRVGGLGWLLGDEGSAYRIGRAALRAAIDYADEIAWSSASACEAHSTLLKHIQSAWNLSSTDALLGALYAPPSEKFTEKHRIAHLAPVVFALAERGNAVCIDVIHDQAGRLARQIAIASRRQTSTEPQSLCLGGGILSVELFRARVLAQVAQLGVTFHQVILVNDAAADAAITLARTNMLTN